MGSWMLGTEIEREIAQLRHLQPTPGRESR
jgi:hypothetical protein